MNLKKMIFINTIITFLLCFLSHFMYKWLPNPLFSIFFPVNESIWEHMKMLFTTILISSIIEYFIMKKCDIEFNNFTLTSFIKAISSIPIYLVIFIPLYKMFGENMFISISVMLLVIFIVNLIGYLLLKYDEIPYQKLIAITFIILIYIVMGILTYKPPKQELFYDIKENKYGINIYENKNTSE